MLFKLVRCFPFNACRHPWNDVYFHFHIRYVSDPFRVLFNTLSISYILNDTYRVHVIVYC